MRVALVLGPLMLSLCVACGCVDPSSPPHLGTISMAESESPLGEDDPIKQVDPSGMSQASCPACGSDDWIILSGRPSSELLERVAKGEVKLPGCQLVPYWNRHCHHCGGYWESISGTN